MNDKQPLDGWAARRQLDQARTFAFERNLKPLKVHASRDWYALFQEELQAYDLSLGIFKPTNETAMQFWGMEICRSSLQDRFWLECDHHMAIVPDGPTTWRMDYVEQWQVLS